jgi:ribosomal protein L35
MARKSVVKRIKVTKTGKLMYRKMAQDHFRAKKRGVQLHRKRTEQALTGANAKSFMQHLAS